MTTEKQNVVVDILEVSNMVDGLDIAILRTRELRERFNLNMDKYTLDNEALNFALDSLLEILRKDKSELESTIKILQGQL